MSINVNYALRESPQATIDDMQRIVDGVASELEVIAFAEKINAMHQHIEKLENKNDVDEQMAGEILRQVLRYCMTLFVQTLIEAHPKLEDIPIGGVDELCSHRSRSCDPMIR